MKRRSGIALVLTAGILVLLSVAGIGFLEAARRLETSGRIHLSRSMTRLLARSGVEYATSRLFQDVHPRTPTTPENQADDWTYRDGYGVPLDKALNPSYAHTEPYTEVIRDGKYDPAVDLRPSQGDWNGSGRFDAWSGRLKGGRAEGNAVFILKVLGEGGKLCVNSGILDRLDRNGNGIPDHCDLAPDNLETRGEKEIIWRNRRLSLLLDTLGQILAVSTADPDPGKAAHGTAFSRLGKDILRHRPPGGYRSVLELRSRVPASDWPRVSDYLTVVLQERATFARELWNIYANQRHELWFDDLRPLVKLGAASEPVVQSLVQGLGLGMSAAGAARWILPEEARQIARWLMRGRPFASWQELYLGLRRDSVSFPSLPSVPSVYDNMAVIPWYDVVYLNAVPDVMGDAGAWFYPPRSWPTYDEDHPASVNPDPRDRREKRPGHKVIVSRRGDQPRQSALFGFSSDTGTLELSLVPGDVVFSIVSLGGFHGRATATAMASATVVAGMSISARTQEDFENRFGFLRGPGYVVVGRPRKDRMQTEPMFPLDSSPDHPEARYSPYYGSLRLMDRSGHRQGDRFYIPGWEQGQPLRKPQDAASLVDNFLDIDRRTSFLPQIARPTPSDVPPAMGLPGDYSWESGGFPLFSPSGEVVRGTIEFWTSGSPAGLRSAPTSRFALCYGSSFAGGGDREEIDTRSEQNPHKYSRIGRITYRVCRMGGFPVEELVAAPRMLGDWLLVDFTFSEEQGIVGYVNGIPDPTLAGAWIPAAEQPPYGPLWRLHAILYSTWGSEADDLRLYDRALTQAETLARAVVPRYWTVERDPDPGWPDDLKDRLSRPPSFLSALYVTDRSCAPSGMAWDGVVPKLIREAVDRLDSPAGEAAVPLGVELWCYGDDKGQQPPYVITLPHSLWRTGGGWADLWGTGISGAGRPPQFRSFRYRIVTDASAVEGFNNETPVLEAVSMVFRTSRLIDLWEE